MASASPTDPSSLLSYVKALGVPSVIALGLTWILSQAFLSDMRQFQVDHVELRATMNTQLKQRGDENLALLSTMRFHDAQTLVHLQTISLLLRQICVIESSTPLERAECFRVFQQQVSPGAAPP